MTCNLVVRGGASPDMAWPIGARPAITAHMGRRPAQAGAGRLAKEQWDRGIQAAHFAGG